MPQSVQSDSEAKFSGFWCHYLRAHAHAGTRALHYIGMIVGLLSIIRRCLSNQPVDSTGRCRGGLSGGLERPLSGRKE